MPSTDDDHTDVVFQALGNRTRRDILRRVLAGEHSVSALAAEYDMSFAAVQKHVAVLERAGLVVKRRAGREQLASGAIVAVRSAAALLGELETLWRGRVARVDELLALDHQPPPTTPSTEDPSCPSPTSPPTSIS